MEVYQLAGLYQVYFSKPGSFPKLQAALGYDPEHIWTEEERKRFSNGLFYFQRTFEKLGGESFPITSADALLVWLKVYPFQSLISSSAELTKSLSTVWPDVMSLAQPNPISVATEVPEEKKPAKSLGRIFKNDPKHLHVAFIHEFLPSQSDWIRAHDLGREYLEIVLEDYVASAPIFGVPASINAFALGAQMTNPEV